MRFVVYTAIFGGYDRLLPIEGNTGNNIDFICFTENTNLKCKGWSFIHLNEIDQDYTNINRKLKIRVLDYFHDYDRSIYIDGNIRILSDLTPLFKKVDNYALSATSHRSRDCVYDEAKRLILDKRVGKGEIESQLNKYKKRGFPVHNGMTENCILVRNHRVDGIKNLQELWWDEFSSGVKRDQISLPYVLWKSGIRANSLDIDPRVPNPFFRWYQHDQHFDKHPLKRMIYYLKNSQNKEWRK